MQVIDVDIVAACATKVMVTPVVATAVNKDKAGRIDLGLGLRRRHPLPSASLRGRGRLAV